MARSVGMLCRTLVAYLDTRQAGGYSQLDYFAEAEQEGLPVFGFHSSGTGAGGYEPLVLGRSPWSSEAIRMDLWHKGSGCFPKPTVSFRYAGIDWRSGTSATEACISSCARQVRGGARDFNHRFSLPSPLLSPSIDKYVSLPRGRQLGPPRSAAQVAARIER